MSTPPEDITKDDLQGDSWADASDAKTPTSAKAPAASQTLKDDDETDAAIQEVTSKVEEVKIQSPQEDPVKADKEDKNENEKGDGAKGEEDVQTDSGLAEALDPLLRGDAKDDLEVRSDDPNSPFYSIRSFEELGHLEDTTGIPEEILKGIRDAGFKQPSKIQEKALPILLRNNKKTEANPSGNSENMIFQSQAGTGKTGAFGITMLTRCHHLMGRTKGPLAICIAPTFGLIIQIYDQLSAWAKHSNIKIGLCYGRSEADRNDKRAVPPPVKARGQIEEQILVCTPGRIRSMLAVNDPRRRQLDPQQIMMLVCDEADDLMEGNHLTDMTAVLRTLSNPKLQKVMVSATFDPSLMDVIKPFMNQPLTTITLPLQQCTMDNVRQLYYGCQEDKLRSLEIIYTSVKVGQTIIFVNTRDSAERVARTMKENGFSVAMLHGKQMKAEQHETLSRFRSGQDRVLVATNALARGVDVKAITMVVNYDVPMKKKFLDNSGGKFDLGPDYENYLHRVGRTGRFGRKGTAITLVGNDREVECVEKIGEYWKRPIKAIDIHNEKHLKKNFGKK